MTKSGLCKKYFAENLVTAMLLGRAQIFIPISYLDQDPKPNT